MTTTQTEPGIAPTTEAPPGGAKPVLAGRRPRAEAALVYAFTLLPMLALVAAVPLAWGWGLSWLDVGLAAGFYLIVRTRRDRRVPPALHPRRVPGPPGPADRARRRRQPRDAGRRHHLGRRPPPPPRLHRPGGRPALAVAVRPHAARAGPGLLPRPLGWLFDRDRTNGERFAPDLLADRDIAGRPAVPAAGRRQLLAPALLGGLVTMSWWGALTAFFWAGLVRVAVLHHVTWSINSICHMFGDRPFATQGRATNFWPLAILSMGESWHNPHHADPTCARHGVGRGQIDMSARRHLGVREVRLGARRPLAHHRTQSPACRPRSAGGLTSHHALCASPGSASGAGGVRACLAGRTVPAGCHL